MPWTAKQSVLISKKLSSTQDGVTLGDLCDRLLQQIINNSHQYKDQLNPPQRIGRIKKTFGNRPAAGIKASEIADWLGGLKQTPATRNRYKAVFSAVFSYGKKRDLIAVKSGS